MALNLEKQSIPDEFIKNLPEGLKVVKQRGVSYVVVEDIRCPNEHSLLSDMIRINGEPAICLNIEGGGAHGAMYLSPYWGLHTKLFDFMFDDASKNPLVKAFCPVCDASLMVARKCTYPGCKAEEYIEFTLPDGKNKVSACGQWGCPEHDMMVTSIPAEVKAAVNKIQYPDVHTHSEAIGF